MQRSGFEPHAHVATGMKAARDILPDASSLRAADYERFELLTDYPRSARAASSRRIESRSIEPRTIAKLAELAREQRCPTFTAILTALVVLLHRCSGETDIAIGLQASSLRTRVLRCNVSSDPTFTELLQRTSAGEAGASTVSELELRSPRFSICATHERAEFRAQGPLVDLHFRATESSDGWTLTCEYDASLFLAKTICVLLATLDVLFEAIVIAPATRVRALPLVSEAERERLIVGLNATGRGYPAERTVAHLLAERARQTPAAIAVVCGERTQTYEQLERASNRLARELLARNLGLGKRVGILLERSADLVVAIVAVLKAGGTFVPLDPGFPLERLGFIARDATLGAVISRASFNARLRTGARFVNLDTDAAAIASRSDEPVEAASTSSPAYLIYTSGSTGQPKGVAVSQRSLVNVVSALAAADAFDITARDVHVAVATISFDVATLDIFLPLTCGATLVIATESEAVDSRALYALLQRSRATFMQATPLTFELLLEAGWNGDPRLKIHVGGDAISRELANRLLASGNQLWNGYGPTETTIVSSLARVDHGNGPVLMGPPLANTQMYVLDRYGEIVPDGVAGELYIGGTGVSHGYFGRPDLTRDRFVADGFGILADKLMYRTGDLVRRRGVDRFEFLGRSDDQIKIRGFRMELGEIEAALLRRPKVCEAVAIVRGSAPDEKTLWAFVVGAADGPTLGDAWISELRSGLSEILPHYMVPASIVVLEALPRTLTGKIDRQALTSHTPARPLASDAGFPPAADARQSRIETLLVAFVSEFLGRESIGRNDDIFSLGFNSLSAMRLVERIERSLNVRVPLHTIYEEPTAARLAARVADAPQTTPASAAPAAIVMLNEQGSRLPFVFFHNDLAADGVYCRRIARVLGSEQPLYAIAPHGTAGLPIRYALEEMARDYLASIRTLQSTGPYRLGGLCAGGLVAYEVARLLRARGEIVERLVLVNSWPLSKRAGLIGARVIRAIATQRHLPLRVRENFCYNVEGFFDASGTGPRGLLAFFIRRTRMILRRALGLPKKTADVETFDKSLSASEVEGVIAHLVAPLTYRPRPYDGDLTVLWSTDEEMPPVDARKTWQGFARTTRVVPVPGAYRILMRDGVEDLGAALKELLTT